MQNSERKRYLEVSLSPALLPYLSIHSKIVVVIDIFRASSAICAAIDYGVDRIIPVRSIEDAIDFKDRGFIAAAERKGEVVSGFDFGNSPFAFMRDELKGKTIVLTTSNCTNAILEATNAKQVLLGAFVNQKVLVDYLLSRPEDVILTCAGWKNNFNLEDTLFAGSLINHLENEFIIECDSALAAQHLFNLAKNDLHQFLKKSSHTRRLKHLGIDEDIKYCLTPDLVNSIPVFTDGIITELQNIKSVTV